MTRPQFATFAIAGALALVACGSDDPVPSAGSSLPASVPSSSPAPSLPTSPPTSPATSTPPATATEPTTSTVAPGEQGGTSDAEREAMRGELVAARQRWTDTAIATYTYHYDIACFCGGPIDVDARVLGGHLIDSPAGDIDLPYWERTVEAWFDTAADNIEGADRVSAVFDPELGYLRRLVVDVDLNTADDEFTFAILDPLAAVADPIERWFTEDWGCGLSFQAGTPDQTAMLHLQFDMFDAPPVEPGHYDLADLVHTTLSLGSDLFADWCDDVHESGEPTPVESRAWTITGGTIDVTFGTDGSASATIRDVVVDDGGTTIELGDATIENSAWGILAG